MPDSAAMIAAQPAGHLISHACARCSLGIVKLGNSTPLVVASVPTGLPQAALTFLGGTLLRPVLLLALEDALEDGRELFLVLLSQVRCQVPGHRDGVTAHDHTNAGARASHSLGCLAGGTLRPFLCASLFLARALRCGCLNVGWRFCQWRFNWIRHGLTSRGKGTPSGIHG